MEIDQNTEFQNVDKDEEVLTEQQPKVKKGKKTLLIILLIGIPLIGLVLGLVLFLVLILGVGGSLWLLSGLSDKEVDDIIVSESTEIRVDIGDIDDIGSSDIIEDSQESPEVSTEEEEVVVDINDYVGYWTISGNTERELTITNGYSADTVYISLWYYGLGEISYVSATIEGNVASFSTYITGDEIRGDLTFEDDEIIVNITYSPYVQLPVESMTFDECHDQSWVDMFEQENFEANMSTWYILPDSSDRYLTYDDLYGLTADELKIARNEIYARHGRRFKNETLQEYFDALPWYYGYIEPDDFTEDVLSDIEQKNLQLILDYETYMGW